MKDRNIGLDILRSIAIWNVLLMHIAIVLYAAKIAPYRLAAVARWCRFVFCAEWLSNR